MNMTSFRNVKNAVAELNLVPNTMTTFDRFEWLDRKYRVSIIYHNQDNAIITIDDNDQLFRSTNSNRIAINKNSIEFRTFETRDGNTEKRERMYLLDDWSADNCGEGNSIAFILNYAVRHTARNTKSLDW